MLHFQINQRLQGGFDLLAEEAKYHGECDKMFRRGRYDQGPLRDCEPASTHRQKRRVSTGRPLDEERFATLTEILHELEDTEMGTMSIEKLLDEMGNSTDPYSEKYLRKLIFEHFQDTIEIKDGLVIVKNRSAAIVRELYKKGTNDCDVLKAAGRLIKESIRTSTTMNASDHYPDMNNFDINQMLQGMSRGLF